MTWLVENWFVMVGIIAAIALIIVMVYKFLGLPSVKQISTIKEWLLYACMEAEKELGNGTGQLKLRYVYDLFITRFPKIMPFVSFTVFSSWVDDALIQMELLLRNNSTINTIVKGVTT